MDSEIAKKRLGRPRKGTEVVTVHVTIEVAEYLRDIGNGDAAAGAGKLLAEVGSQHIELLQNLSSATEYLNGTSNSLLKQMSQMMMRQEAVYDALSTLMTGKPKGNA